MGQNRWVIVVVVTCLSFLVPAALCLALGLAGAGSVLALASATLATAAWMTLLVLVNWWEFTSIHLRWVWGAALAAVAAYRGTSASALPPTSGLDLVTVAGVVAAAPAFWLIGGALAARRPGGGTLDFSPPLLGGRFLVTDGGDGARSFLVNYHYGFGSHRAGGVSRSMRYATDIVEIGPLGGECRGFFPARNEAYRIWERPLHAPCDGVVAEAKDEVEDNAAFGHHRPYGVGNQVVIRAGSDVYIVLGHMRHGSLSVTAGDSVRAGQKIGLVGNSGWTERPHLHMQAMRSPSGDWWHGDPVPFRLGGRFLARNDSF